MAFVYIKCVWDIVREIRAGEYTRTTKMLQKSKKSFLFSFVSIA